MSFLTQVEDLIGTCSDTTAVTDFLTAGARITADYLTNKGSDKCELYATDKADADGITGIDVTGGVVISAHKSYRKARRIPAEMKAMALDSDSIHYALATDPVWYLLKEKGYVLPGGGTLRHFLYPTVVNSESAIDNFPPQTYPTVVRYAAMQYLLRKISDLTITTMGAISISIPIAITAPSAPEFSYVAALADTVGTATISFADSLEFTPPVFGGSYTTMDTALTNQDVELASGYNQKIQSQLEQYSQDLQNAVARFQEDLQEYQLGLQKAIENARLDSTRYAQQAQLTTDINLQNQINVYRSQVDEYSAILGKYQGEVSNYAARVQAEISRVQALIAQYSLMLQGHLQILENLRKEFQLSLESL